MCSGCRRRATQGRGRDATAEARSAPQNGAAGAPQPRHMTPCACHCAACRAAGHGNKCVEIRKALLRLFKADVVDFWILRHYYGACGWGTARLDAAIRCVQYGPAGDVIAAGDDTGRIHFICAQTGEKILCPLRCDSAVLSVAYSADGTKLAAGLDRDSNSVVVFNTQTNEQICSLSGEKQIFSVAFSPDGSLIAAGGGGLFEAGTPIRLYNAATGDPFGSPLKVDNRVNSIAYSPDGSKLAAAHSKTVSIFNMETNEVQCTVTGHFDRVNSVCWNNDGTKLASGSTDKTVKIWNPATGECLWTLNTGGAVAGQLGVLSVSFSPKGDMVAAGCDNGNIFVVDAAAGQIKSSVKGHLWDNPECLCWHRFSRAGIEGYTHRRVPECPVRGHGAAVSSLAFKPDDPNVLVTGSHDQTVKLWDLCLMPCPLTRVPRPFRG